MTGAILALVIAVLWALSTWSHRSLIRKQAAILDDFVQLTHEIVESRDEIDAERAEWVGLYFALVETVAQGNPEQIETEVKLGLERASIIVQREGGASGDD